MSRPVLSTPPAPGATIVPTTTPASSSSSSSSSSFNVSEFLSKNWGIVLGGTIATGAIIAACYALYVNSQKDQKPKPKKEPKKEEAVKKVQSEEKEAPKEKDVSEMTEEEKLEKAKKLKDKGNKYFQGKSFEKALELYQEAIDLSPQSKEASVFYGNKAACYANLHKHDKVIENCNKALDINKKYVKALNRRAIAHEALNDHESALVDLTASCILDEFKNEDTLKSADKLIKEIAQKKAQSYLTTKTLHPPSHYFIKAYLNSFRNRFEYPQSEGDPENNGDTIYLQVVEKLKADNFEGIEEEVSKALSEGTTFKALALNLRGTLRYLSGDFDAATADFAESIALRKTSNTLIKRATVNFETKKIEAAMEDFQEAVSQSPDDPDVYYHRGQAYFILGNVDGALNDYKKSIELDDTAPYVHVQLAVVYFRLQNVQHSLETFKKAFEKFPDYGDLHNYYGEVQIELQKFDEALEQFDLAFHKNPSNPMSLINKAFLLYNWKQDVDAALVLLKKALEIDPYCEIGYAHMGQMYIRNSDLASAISAYEKAIECSRTEAEITQWVSCIVAAKAQAKVFDIYPEFKDKKPF